MNARPSLMTTAFLEALFPYKCPVCRFFYHPPRPIRSGWMTGFLRNGKKENRAAAQNHYTAADLTTVIGAFVCPDCCRGISPVQSPLCSVCGVMFKGREGEDHVCGGCIDSPKRYAYARSFGVYDRTLMALIHRLKYGGNIQSARPLGRLLFLTFITFFNPRRIDLIVPVPLHKKKLKQRGFNQAFLLVREWFDFGKMSGISLSHIRMETEVLYKAEQTKAQIGLNKKERMLNVKHTFALKDRSVVAGKHILLVDDVHTTGSTVNECAKTLIDGGAETVYVLTSAQSI